ncbi:MAG TPA: AraC family transcriptional regulator [Vicinamibacterales bacterium]
MFNPKPPRKLTVQGQILRWRTVGDLALAEVVYEPGQRLQRATQPHARFVLILKGALAEVHGNGAPTVHGPSTLIFEAANLPHSYAVSDHGAVCLVIDMEPAWVARAQAQAPVLAETRAFRRGLLLHLAHRLDGEFRLRDEVSRLAIESLTLGVMAEASRRVKARERPAPMWLQAAMAFIQLHFAEQLSLTKVANHAGVHPVHLARTFRAVYQTSLAAHVRELRIEFARQQLAGPAALSEIACAAGFCDQSHFSRCFKQHTGLTPAAYRARLR